jgi:3-methyladenine DNA glycosylase/8-oxoguanine DNA glycosylase
MPLPSASAVERRRSWRPAWPVDLRRTLGALRRGSGDPALQVTEDSAWRATGTPAGAATLHLQRRADGSIEATAWGDGADWLLDGLPEMLGDGDDWSTLDVSVHTVLHRTHRSLPGLRLTRTRNVWEAIIPAILEQKVVGLDAWLSYRQLIRRFGTIPPGPAPEGMRMLPTAAQWRRIPSWEFHRAGVDPKRAATTQRVAMVADALQRTVELGRGGPEVTAKLCTIPGVGVWTAAETVQRSHGDPDTVSVGDYHLAHVVGTVFLGRRVDDDGMLELLAPWLGQRQRVMRLIELCGIGKQRFGPRMGRIDYRAI